MVKGYLLASIDRLYECICDNDKLSHNAGNCDFGRLSCVDELSVFCLEFRIEACSDQGGHIERLSDIGPSSPDEALAFPLPGLSRDRGQSSESCGLFAGAIFVLTQVSSMKTKRCGSTCPW